MLVGEKANYWKINYEYLFVGIGISGSSVSLPIKPTKTAGRAWEI